MAFIKIEFVILRPPDHRCSGGAIFWGTFFLDSGFVISMHHVRSKRAFRKDKFYKTETNNETGALAGLLPEGSFRVTGRFRHAVGRAWVLLSIHSFIRSVRRTQKKLRCMERHNVQFI